MSYSIANKTLRQSSLVAVLTIFLAGFYLFSSLLPAFAATEPKQVVSGTVDDIRKEIKSNGEKLSAADLDAKLMSILEPVFDFEEMARRSLGIHWRSINDEQRSEFVSLFSDLLARNYLKKIRENIATSNFKIVGDRVKEEKAMVQTEVEQDGRVAGIDYRLRLKGDSWRVYDVIIENIGLISNYRSEFSGIIRKEKFEGLIQRLKDKK